MPAPVTHSDPQHSSASACLQFMEFDTEMFQMPFFRVVRLDKNGLQEEIERLPEHCVVDAKVPLDQTEWPHLLPQFGFRRVCTMFTLVHSLKESAAVDSDAVEFSGTLDLPEETLWEHARNFVSDRFSQDPLLPEEGKHRLFYHWVRNSLTKGRKRVAAIGRNFCTFSVSGEGVVVDLVSVLDKRQGMGRAIMTALVEQARREGLRTVTVTTECENAAAWKLYSQIGFTPAAFTAAFHLVR